MTRILELIVSLVIVFVLAVLVGVILPAHGHIERSVEVSSPLRQVFDSVDSFRRFAEWGAPHKLDPQVKTTDTPSTDARTTDARTADTGSATPRTNGTTSTNTHGAHAKPTDTSST